MILEGCGDDMGGMVIIWEYGWYTLCVGVRKLERERAQSLNTVVRDSLGAGLPWYVITQLKSCPVDRLGPYLNGACSHRSHFSSVQPQFNSSQFFSSVLQLSTVERLSNCWSLSTTCTLPHPESTRLRVVTWDHHTKYPLDKGHAGPHSL